MSSTSGVKVTVAGAGPAGTSAALSALAAGAAVEIRDRSAFPRHKVCGEFLSPEVMPLLERLGVASRVLAARPALMRRVRIVVGRRGREDTLPDPALGLSRYRFDYLMLEAAIERGAQWLRRDAGVLSAPAVWATGRGGQGTGGREERLFGFKAHFRGPANDAVELYFFGDCYVGVNPVEHGLTNVCGLAPRRVLAGLDFDVDALLASYPPLRERTAPVQRVMDWFHTGPLVFAQRFGAGDHAAGVYPAGDALSFVDPFTGSGRLGAVLTGILAGEAAVKGLEIRDYLADCQARLARLSRVCSVIRFTFQTPWICRFVPWVPVVSFYRLTRPDLAVRG